MALPKLKLLNNNIIKELDMSLSYNGRKVFYYKVKVGLVKSLYDDDDVYFVIKPLIKNDKGEWYEIYSFEEDYEYYRCMTEIHKADSKGLPYPEKEENFVKALLTKKNKYRLYVNDIVSKLINEKIETGFCMNVWRDQIIDNKSLQDFRQQYLDSLK